MLSRKQDRQELISLVSDDLADVTLPFTCVVFFAILIFVQLTFDVFHYYERKGVTFLIFFMPVRNLINSVLSFVLENCNGLLSCCIYISLYLCSSYVNPF